MAADDVHDRDGFVSRWARRKARARSGAAVVEPAPGVAPLPSVPPLAEPAAVALAPRAEPAVPVVAPAEPLPTLADVALLTRESDYSRFVAAGVDEGVKCAAMKKLFADPHFNVMDGLDTYIADYGIADPIPPAMLRSMNQSKFLRLFDDEEEDDEAKKTAPAAIAAAPATEPVNPTDDHADLRLQQDDAIGQPGPDQGAGA